MQIWGGGVLCAQVCEPLSGDSCGVIWGAGVMVGSLWYTVEWKSLDIRT